jgi:hypothetical protein
VADSSSTIPPRAPEASAAWSLRPSSSIVRWWSPDHTALIWTTLEPLGSCLSVTLSGA